MPFGATPSRWCVCQFHHFRTLQLLDTNDLASCSKKDEFRYTRPLARPGMSRADRRNIVIFIVSCPVTSPQREWNRCMHRARISPVPGRRYVIDDSAAIVARLAEVGY